MGKNFRIPFLLCLCAVAAYAQTVGGVGGMEPVSNFLARLATWFSSTPARLIVIIGVGVYCITLLFGDRHDHGTAARVIIGGVGLVFLQTMVSYWIG